MSCRMDGRCGRRSRPATRGASGPCSRPGTVRSGWRHCWWTTPGNTDAGGVPGGVVRAGMGHRRLLRREGEPAGQCRARHDGRGRGRAAGARGAGAGRSGSARPRRGSVVGRGGGSDRRRRSVPRLGTAWPWTVVCGVFDITANALYFVAVHRGTMSIIAPVAALYPVSTVLLALAVDGERVRPIQVAGLGLAATALVLTASPA